jgi:hypothetical protein
LCWPKRVGCVQSRSQNRFNKAWRCWRRCAAPRPSEQHGRQTKPLAWEPWEWKPTTCDAACVTRSEIVPGTRLGERRRRSGGQKMSTTWPCLVCLKIKRLSPTLRAPQIAPMLRFVARKSTIETFRSRPFSIRTLGTFRTRIPNRANAHDRHDSKYEFQPE